MTPESSDDSLEEVVSLEQSQQAADDLKRNVGYLIGRIRLSLWTILNRRMIAQFGVTNPQANLLFLVLTGGPRPITVLAKDCGTDSGAMTRLVDRLQSVGLLLRRRSTSDRRVLTVELTEAGQSVAVKLPRLFSEVVDSVLPELETGQKENLLRVLEEMLENCENKGDELVSI